MGWGKGKSDKGAARGHSRQDNWLTHQEEKADGRQRRRREKAEAERQAKRGLDEEQKN